MMSVLKRILKPKVIAAVILLIAIIFGVYNIIWFRYIKTTFGLFIENEKLKETEQVHELLDTGWTEHRYENVEGSDFRHVIATPSYLKFGGNLVFSKPIYVDGVDDELVYISECVVSLMVFPKNWRYVLDIADLSGGKKVGSGVRQIAMRVDRDGNPYPRPDNDPEPELYEEWLVLYNKYQEPVMELFAHIKQIYGEDAFG